MLRGQELELGYGTFSSALEGHFDFVTYPYIESILSHDICHHAWSLGEIYQSNRIGHPVDKCG
ncbi:MAG: hypothetical protein ABS35_14490 [Kaistia sp. SCN 65-12]|nr:MAG: hypothetical protein ABS35_14490 [Kaistia sp. SCN 65-12]